METFYDYVTVALFAAFAVLLLQRSVMQPPPDSLWAYLPPAVACAAANQAGNAGHDALAVCLILATVVYAFKVLQVRVRW
ncbi:hypothetical protein H7F50_11770 [Novosphingobium flavum]|uniref:Uncharacterized protein n=1 Tax=Novosphingobium aerophilum TaxID=2839843 RepID=A0A7X1KDZ5_9SPHN|nr:MULTISPECIES: XrtV sorting system accessory protein [Novosphingobium]MBC2653662.1 hypothetical protein [Novosphingobium aerophilum]MBC2662434.1 hypothetical protein [Novosphingobium aerophilum]